MNDNQRDADFAEFLLSTVDAVDQTIFHGPGVKLGGAEPDIHLRQVRLRIGRRATIHNLRKLYDAVGAKYPSELGLFTTYDVWLLAFNVSLIKDGGFNSVTRLGCQVEYPEGTSISIVSQLPETEFISKAKSEFVAAAEMSADGEAKVPTLGASVGGAAFKIGGSVAAELSGKGTLNLSFSVMSDRVVATGIGDYLGEWSIKRGELPLLGEQRFLSAVLVPRETVSLEVKVRAYVTVTSPFLVPARLNSDWVSMELTLDEDAEVARES